jgi:hypothetical protein
LFFGLYVAETCWLGLYILQIDTKQPSSITQAVCIGILLLFTALKHRQISSKYQPLLERCTLNKDTSWNNVTYEYNNMKANKSLHHRLTQTDSPAARLLPPECTVKCPKVWIPYIKRRGGLPKDIEDRLALSDDGIIVKSSGKLELLAEAHPPMVNHPEEARTVK